LGLARSSSLKQDEELREGDARYIAPEIIKDVKNY
jgi:hypothetical protein